MTPEGLLTLQHVDVSLRRVTQLLVTELWDDSGTRPGRIAREDLAEDDVRQLLRSGPVQFVEIAMGERPSWVPIDQRFEFWKNQLQPKLAQWGPDGRIYTDEFPVYVASEWDIEGLSAPVVVATLFD